MTDDLRTLLNRVAAGELSPEEAEILMNAAKSAASGTDQPPSDQPAPDQPAPEPVRRISVRGSAVRLVIVADPTVDTAIAEGPHRVSHVGDRLTVHSDLRVGEYEAEAPKSTFATWLSNVNRAGSTLRVRVNPDLPLDVLNVAGSLELSGMRATTSVGVEAGSAKLHDGAGQLTLSVASGSADVEWLFQGECSVSTDLGSARLTLLPGSDVTVKAEASLGLATIRLADGTTIKATPEGHPPVIAGAGTGTLGATTRLGSLVVSVF
ncbi:MAG: hypothetical protein MUF09_06760 [Candidatus Nanopelagicales bacterium]|nr:hypothetical protein [Candidatus Nanopelagicales bacterium]